MPAETVKELYKNALERAKARSLQPDYRDCSVHVAARIGLVDRVPAVVGFSMSDWCDNSTVATFVNGEQR